MEVDACDLAAHNMAVLRTLKELEQAAHQAEQQQGVAVHAGGAASEDGHEQHVGRGTYKEGCDDTSGPNADLDGTAAAMSAAATAGWELQLSRVHVSMQRVQVSAPEPAFTPQDVPMAHTQLDSAGAAAVCVQQSPMQVQLLPPMQPIDQDKDQGSMALLLAHGSDATPITSAGTLLLLTQPAAGCSSAVQSVLQPSSHVGAAFAPVVGLSDGRVGALRDMVTDVDVATALDHAFEEGQPLIITATGTCWGPWS